MKPDELSHQSREFYERAKFKLVLSLMMAAFGMMFLGFAAQSGSDASYNYYLYEQNPSSGFISLRTGYGFACTGYLIAAIALTVGAACVSPYFGSSINERKTLQSPQQYDVSDIVVFSV